MLFVRLFSFTAAQVPPAGLRKENGKMKINYTFANGETSEVEVTEEIGNMILDSRRQESNLDRKERYHCYSSDAAEFEGEEYADADTPESLLERDGEQTDRGHPGRDAGNPKEKAPFVCRGEIPARDCPDRGRGP